MAHPSRISPGGFAGAHERGDGKGAGTGQGDAWGHCTGQKQVEGEERLQQHSRFSHYNLQHLCCNYTHICTRLTSLRSSPSHLVAVSWTPYISHPCPLVSEFSSEILLCPTPFPFC